MATKKKEVRSYGQSYVPSYTSKELPIYQKKQVYFYGLNRNDDSDDGYLSDCLDIDASKFPAIVPSRSSSLIYNNSDTLEKPHSIYAFNGSVYVVSCNSGTLKIVKYAGGSTTTVTYEGTSISDDIHRELAVYCAYEGGDDDIVYEKTAVYYLICMPDRIYIPVDFESGDEFEVIQDAPALTHMTVHNGRIFGAKEGLVICSASTGFTDWTTDSSGVSEDSTLVYNETNAWYSTTQSNTKSLGDITAIVSYDGHPVFFKKDYMHQINNNKNPFRVYDIAPVGALSGRGVVVYNSVLYFVSGDGVYRYAGGYPEKISDPLNIHPTAFNEDCLLGAANDTLYFYIPFEDKKVIFTYGITTGQWAKISSVSEDLNCFTTLDETLYSVDKFGNVYIYNVGDYSEWEFCTTKLAMREAEDKRLHSFKIGYGTANSSYETTVTVSVIDAYSQVHKVAKTETESGIESSLKVGLRGFDDVCHRIKVRGRGYIKVRSTNLIYSVSGKRYNSEFTYKE